MLIKTRGVVLNSIKYGESDLILKCLTQEGLKSYMVRGVFSKRNKKFRRAYFQPLSLLELTADHNTKGNLNRLREVRSSYLYQQIPTHFVKQAVALFLSEVLSSAIREEQADPALFEYVETSLIWLDMHEGIANFHLLFLLNLTRFLGFYPDAKNKDYDYFDLLEGYFCKSRPSNPHLDEAKLILFRSLIGIKFDDVVRLKWNSEKRTDLIESLLTYYELHLPGFHKPRSLNVLKDVFDEAS